MNIVILEKLNSYSLLAPFRSSGILFKSRYFPPLIRNRFELLASNRLNWEAELTTHLELKNYVLTCYNSFI